MIKDIQCAWRVQERHKKYVKKWAKQEKLSEAQIIRNMIDARHYGKLHFPPKRYSIKK